MYEFHTKTTLMKNQKAAQVLSDQSQFSVLQTSLGQSLFFSIGDENILYLSAEQDNVKTGWTPIDLTTELAVQFPGKTVTAKLFAVAQDSDAGTIAIAQVLHVAEDGTDYLFAMTGLSNAPDATWIASAAGRSWMARPYDDVALPVSAPDIGYVYLSARGSAMVVGLQQPATGYFQNYTVSLDSTVTHGVWQAYLTAENFDQPPSLVLGKSKAATVDGLYQLAALDGEQSLTFTPLKARFGTPTATVFTVPPGASAIATVPIDSGGDTDLYIAGDQAIFLLTAGSQTNFARATAIINDPLVAGVTDLKVHASDDWVILWGRSSPQGQLFCARCPVGQQADPDAWSAPIPIQSTSIQVASLLDQVSGANVLYVHIEGDDLVQLRQDPVTTQWRTRSILLPHLAVSDMVERYTFTTHITVTVPDANNHAIAGQSFALTSTSPCTVYVNDLYTTLSDSEAVTLTADSSGTVTIVQETQSLGAVCYNLAAGDGSTVNINPMQASLSVMQGINSGADLSAVTVTDERGNQAPLVPPSVSDDDRDHAAKAIAMLVSAGAVLPADGSLAPPSSRARHRAGAVTGPDWGLSITDGRLRYSEVGPGDAPLLAVDDAIEVLAGDILQWMAQAEQEFSGLYVKAETDVVHAWVTFENNTYHFLILCHEDLLNTLQFVYSQIEVLIDKLVQWLGFIFEWNDILRTHKVLKNIMRQYSNSVIAGLDSTQASLASLFENLENQINAFSGLPATTGTLAGYSGSAAPTPGMDEPQSHWGISQVKSNISGATSSYAPTVPNSDALQQILNDVLDTIKQESDNMMKAIREIKTQIVDPLPNLTVSEIVERFVAIVADLGLSSVETILTSIIDALQILIQGASGVVDEPIDIPVLSPIYKEYAGDDLSFLDLACLVAAIPTTISYKVARNAAPFPDDATTQALIDAQDFASIVNILNEGATRRRPGATDTLDQVISFILNGAGAFGALMTALLGAAKAQAPTDIMLASTYATAYVFYVAPDIPVTNPLKQQWWQQLNDAITGISVIKTFADIYLAKSSGGKALGYWTSVSPIVEFAINLVWQVPTTMPIVPTEDYTPDGSAIIAFLGGTSFDVGGMLTPQTSEVWQPDAKVREISVTAQSSCALIYGLTCLMQMLLGASDTAVHAGPAEAQLRRVG